MISDADNRIMAVNPAFTRITGYPEAEVLGKTPALLASGTPQSGFLRADVANLAGTGQMAG